MNLVKLLTLRYLLVFTTYATKAPADIIACKNKYSLLGSKENEAEIVDVTLGAVVYLKCSFCGEKSVQNNKIWFFKRRGKNALREIANTDNYKTLIDADSTLQLINFATKDVGIYTCKSKNAEDNDAVFIYVLDGILPVKANYFSGAMSQWQNYKNTVLDPFNEMLEKSEQEPFLNLKKDYMFSFRLFTLWEEWGPCITSNNHAIRYKIGKCFLYPLPNNVSSVKGVKNIQDTNNYYLSENYDVSCNSVKLKETFPLISEIVTKIPQYKAVEDCPEIHNDEAIYVPNENKLKRVDITDKNKDYYYSTIKQIAENGHLTLVCPDVSFDSDVQWFKDNVLLGPSFRNNMAVSEDEPHITIDSYNALYILHATKNEEGVYTCSVDGKKVQNYTLKIVSKSKLLNDEFVRYSIYLSFVLTISLACYCTGVCVAWNRRSSFADPLNLLGENNKIGTRRFL